MTVAGAIDPTLPTAPSGGDAASERAQARRETRRLLLRKPGFVIGVAGRRDPRVLCRVRRVRRAVRPIQRLQQGPPAAQPGALLRDGPARPRRLLAGRRRGPRRVRRRPTGCAHRRGRGHPAGPDHGLLRRPHRRSPEPHRRGVPGPAGHPRRAADAGRPGLVDDRRHRGRRHPVHADRGAHGAVSGPDRAPTRLRDVGQAAGRVRPVHHAPRDLPEHPGPDRGRTDGATRATRSSRSRRCRSWASGSSRRRPTGACRSPRSTPT